MTEKIGFSDAGDSKTKTGTEMQPLQPGAFQRQIMEKEQTERDKAFQELDSSNKKVKTILDEMGRQLKDIKLSSDYIFHWYDSYLAACHKVKSILDKRDSIDKETLRSYIKTIELYRSHIKKWQEADEDFKKNRNESAETNDSLTSKFKEIKHRFLLLGTIKEQLESMGSTLRVNVNISKNTVSEYRHFLES